MLSPQEATYRAGIYVRTVRTHFLNRDALITAPRRLTENPMVMLLVLSGADTPGGCISFTG